MVMVSLEAEEEEEESDDEDDEEDIEISESPRRSMCVPGQPVEI